MPRKLPSAALVKNYGVDKPVPKPKVCPLCQHDPLAHPGSHDGPNGVRYCMACGKDVHEKTRSQEQICELTQYEVLRCLA